MSRLPASPIPALAKWRLAASLALAALIASFGASVLPAYGAQLGNRSLELSSSAAGVSSDYRLRFTTSTIGPLGSIVIRFCSNSPIIEDVCTPPPGLDASSATLTSQSGATGFVIAPGSSHNEIKLTRPPAPVGAIELDYTFKGVVNPSSNGTYYGRVQTYASSDDSGPSSDSGGLAFAVNPVVSINAEVPPYLTFCTGITMSTPDCASAAGSYASFGELSPDYASTASSKLLAATNAKNGYNVSVSGSTMVSGNNEINAMNGDASRAGASQFGLNLRANSNPPVGANPDGAGHGQPLSDYNRANFYKFHSGDRLVAASGPDAPRRYTASYVVNVPRGQAPGVYTTTLTYICVGNF